MPVWEICEFSVTPGKEDEYEKAVLEFAPVFLEFEGCTAFQLQKAVDVEGRFLLLIEWQTIEDHTEKAPQQDGFKRFVSVVEPMWSAPPRLYHTSVVSPG